MGWTIIESSCELFQMAKRNSRYEYDFGDYWQHEIKIGFGEE
jgi:hypothetical protein